MSSYAHIHVFLYLHAETNINTLLYWSGEGRGGVEAAAAEEEEEQQQQQEEEAAAALKR